MIFRRVERRLALALSLLAGACSPGEVIGVDSVSSPIVYGADDRQELYQVDSAEVRTRVEGAMVALVPKRLLVRASPGGLAATTRPLAEVAALCPEERFGDQPAAAFCSGVLVDWDLVLTAGHCTRLFAPQDFAVVFGYFYSAPGKLAFHDRDVVDVAGIVSEALSGSPVRPRIDYAWLRLARPMQPPRQPVPLRRSVNGLRAGDAIVFAGASGGVPIKVDRGGSIANLGEPWFDYFVASTDSARGASGGGAFAAAELALLGLLERGGPDFVMSDRGCRVTVRVAADAAPEEELAFAGRALEGLCAHRPGASSLCRLDCGDPCVALPPPPTKGDAGCSFAAESRATGAGSPILVLLLLTLARAGRRV